MQVEVFDYPNMFRSWSARMRASKKVALGTALPQFGKQASREAIAQAAKGAEDLGLDSLWVQERLLLPAKPRDQYGGGPWPQSYFTVYDPIETLTFAAAKTERIRLGTSVIDALFHVPVTLARRVATLDQLSGGRVLAGLGQGWSKDEFETANVPIKRRGRGFEEFIAAMRAAWGPDPVSFSGQFYRIPESKIGPKPVQRGGPPVILGTYAPTAVERAGRIGDGIMPVVGSWTKLEDLHHMIGSFHSALKAAGRRPEKMHVVLRISGTISPEPLKDKKGFLVGNADQVASELSGLTELGVNHVFFDMNFSGVPVKTQLRLLGRLRSKLG